MRREGRHEVIKDLIAEDLIAPGVGPQVQVEQLTQMVEGITARLAEPERKGFWQRVFGK